ncbi:MAG: trypsin-like peptidase domain-containing protein [Planctomycetaceae bacterium]
MLDQVAPGAAIESFDSGLESSGLSEDDAKLVTEGLDGLSRGDEIEPDQQHALEAIVLKRNRPVVNIIENDFSNPPHPWQHLGQADIKRRLKQAIPSIGRIELPGHPRLPYAGTGFVVGANLLMTNRHVAEIFANGFGLQQLTFKPNTPAAIDFRREIIASDPQLLNVKRIAMIHPFWDMALLVVEGLSDDHPALTLSVAHPDELKEREIAVIGYPAQDRRNDIKLQNEIFGGVFDVKRLQPGKLKTRRTIRSFGNLVNSVTHDASTLGGNSGSAIVDLKTGEILGLHFAGLYLDANFAVPTYELARDQRIVQTGVQFSGSVPSTGEWDDVWRRSNMTERTSAPAPLPVTAAGGSVTMNIPLQITVSLGHPSVAPPANLPTDPPETRDEEGLFRRATDEAAIRTAYTRFSRASLESSGFSWSAALGSAVCSHLVYRDRHTVIDTMTNRFGFSDCEFVVNGATQCFVAKSDAVNLVCFRGTESTGDWLINLRLFSIGDDTYGSVHRGFYFAFQSLKETLESLMDDDLPIVLTGHSLGGALATIASAEWNSSVQAVYTFGQPAVGKRDFQEFVGTTLGAKFSRMVNDNDIVPQVPPGYRHVGKLFHFQPGGSLNEGIEAPIDADESPMMSKEEFENYQESLKQVSQTGDVPEVNESIGQESLFPNTTDHRMDQYMRQILRQS